MVVGLLVVVVVVVRVISLRILAYFVLLMIVGFILLVGMAAFRVYAACKVGFGGRDGVKVQGEGGRGKFPGATA